VNVRSTAAVALATALAVALVAARTRDSDLPSFWDPVPNNELAEAIVSRMSDEELLAQTLMFGWAGEEPSEQVIAWVERRELGSVKVFGWNTDNTEKVASAVTLLQKKAAAGRFGIPLFVATDQEGGWIRHVKGRTTETPGNLAIGASGLPMDAYYSGYYISRELAAIGINLNFAPTVDLYTDHESTVIGPRSFGEDPEAAGALGAAFVAGSRAAGLLTTAKHFPGHGDTGLDSHGALPVIPIGRKTFYERELVPFRRLVEAGVPAIMSGHLSFPALCPAGEPATFSRTLLEGVLRKELGFNGLIVTDDMMMNGATQYAGSVSRAVALALEAGNDIIESSTTPHFGDPIWSHVLGRMRADPAFRARVADAARRVVLAKLDYFKGEKPVPLYPDIAALDDRVPDPDGRDFFVSMAARAITVVRGKGLPYRPAPNERVLVAGSFPDFLEAGTRRFPGADALPISRELLRAAGRYDTVIFCLASRENLSVLRGLRGLGHRIIVISALSPVYLAEVPWVSDALACYSYAPSSFVAAFSALAGDFEPTGRMPLKGIE